MSTHIAFAGRCVLSGADRHPHAATRLREQWPELDWVTPRTGEAFPESLPRIELTEAGTEEGAFRITASDSPSPLVVVEGGPFSGVIYGVEELLQRLASPTRDGFAVEPGVVSKRPSLAYRTFWTWDHSSNWELSQVGHQEIGVFNPYGKPSNGFLKDYKRMVDFCSRSQIAAIVIYGFFRDSHGGVAAAQELADYANARGVRIIPGVAIGAYGGVYWEGDHKYNLSTWLDQNPQYAADMEKGVGFQLEDLAFSLSFPRSDYTRTACPSEPANIAWMEDAISWLVETVNVGGVNIESGDYGVCGCARCVSRRADREDAARREGHAESWSHADMADNFPRLFDATKSQRPDAWVYSELQWDNLLDSTAHEPLKALPQGGIYQHTVNRTYWETHREAITSETVNELPTATNVLRAQFACQWNGDERTERYAFNAPVFAEMSQKAASVGMQGLTIWGEPSPYHASAEFSYLAFGRFGYDASLTWEQFVEHDIAPRVGGTAEAERFIALMGELDNNQHLDVRDLDRVRGEALEGARSTSGDQLRRWLWLADRANQRRYMGS